MKLNEFNQHMLVDEKVIRTLVGGIRTNSNVVEIGPGTGNITKELVKKTNNLIVVEKDEELYREIKNRYPNIITENMNILEYKIPSGSVVVGNIPFNITEPLVEKIADSDISEAIIIVGDKYANSIIDDKNYNMLTLLTKSFFRVELLLNVHKKSFSPVPRTNAKVIKLIHCVPDDKTLLVFRELFLRKNMKIKNSLRESLVKVFLITKNEARDIISHLDMSDEVLNSKIDNIDNIFSELLFNAINKINR